MYAIDFEAAVQSEATSGRAAPAPVSFRVHVELPLEVFRSDAWSVHSAGERNVRLLGIAKDYLREHGLPPTLPAHLTVATTPGGVAPTLQQQMNEPFQIHAPLS